MSGLMMDAAGYQTCFTKEQLALLCANYDGRIDSLGAENAKLLELVMDMWQFTGAACKKYPRLFDPAAQGGQMVQPNMIDAFEQRMRELGIEVE